MDHQVERRLAAILVADIVGYSRLIGIDEVGTLAAIKELRARVIDPLIADSHGRIVKLMGDGVLAEFGSVVDAVTCAVAIQNGVSAQQPDVPSERRIGLRMGINLGDVVVEGDDLLGDGVNVASRLEQLCPAGGVLISGTVYDQLQGKLDVPLDFAGEQPVKNIARPVRTYSVRLEGRGQPWRLRLRQHSRRLQIAAAALVGIALIGGSVWWMRPVETAIAKPSIAVLPFDDIGGDEATARLANGITEDIITDLARYHDLEVIARNSVEAYKGRAVDIREVGRELSVRYVLEGSIQRQAERVRLTAQLIETNTGTHVWSDRWDRPVDDVFAVQTEIAEQVSAKLGGYAGRIIEADRDAAKRKRPNDLDAYDLYLLGIEAKHKETKEELEKAITLLKQSIALDPTFARAWSGLAFAYDIYGRWAEDWNESHRLDLEAARRAVELDPLDAEAHCALAFALGEEGNFAEAEIELNKALDLNPNSAEVLTWYAAWASAFGKADQGAEAADRAMRLNPNPPNWATSMLRTAYFFVGRYQDALRLQQRRPRGIYSGGDHVFSASILAGLGRQTEAAAAVKEALADRPQLSIESWLNDPALREAERSRLLETMRKAGFPTCASAEYLKQSPKLKRLPECTQAQATN